MGTVLRVLRSSALRSYLHVDLLVVGLKEAEGEIEGRLVECSANELILISTTKLWPHLY